MDNYSNLLMDECPPDLRPITVSACGRIASSSLHGYLRASFYREDRLSPEDENKSSIKKASLTKGMATSFGFKRRPTNATSVAENPTAARRLANASTETIDNNGNTGDTEPLTTNAMQSGRSTPHRLPPPKKEAAGTKVSRFGFRQSNANRLNRVADINTHPPAHMEYSNNNKEVEKLENAIKAKVEMHKTSIDSNKNRTIKVNGGLPQPNKFTLQSNQLPRPMPIKIMESKTAKTLANNNTKQNQQPEETEDSGVGSDNIQQLDCSPMFRRTKIRGRNLEAIVCGNTFDVRDIDEVSEPITLPLPPLPSAFQRQNSGFVRDRTIEYQRKIDNDRIRRNSLTSSDASSHYEEEKRVEKPKSFLKTRIKENDSSPPSSDDQMWNNAAGEAMADDFSCSFSSSDESREKDQVPVIHNKMTATSIGSALQNLMTASLTSTIPKSEIRNVILSIEDPKFAAVAANAEDSINLEDETSPVDSIVCSYSEDTKKNNSFSNSKDINEKLTLSAPGSPTNESNSLSLSDDREDFLIDDEIADQPALVFDDTLTAGNSEAYSEATPTLVETTPVPKRRIMGAFEGSPLILRNKKLLSSRTGSLDTLSPCESIDSDDCMLDLEQSQSSGVEDLDRTEQSSCRFSLDDVKVRSIELKTSEIMRDWPSILSACDTRSSTKRLSSRPTRLLRSRAATPGSHPDSPRDVIRGKSSPLRLSSRSSTGTGGYDSDDSAIRVDRAQHSAMQQDVMGIKTMLLKLKRVLNECEARNSLENGFFNGFSSDCDKDTDDGEFVNMDELANLRRQVLFLQDQLEDKERMVQNLQEEMVKLATDQQNSQSAPASVNVAAMTCNAATQTERLRPISAGPSLLQGSPTEANGGLVRHFGVNEGRRPKNQRSLPPQSTTSRLWRTPGEAAVTPQRSSIPRRSCSRSRGSPQTHVAS
ncbi:PREDICTED: uncharacterized protein LOC108564041 isoform X3 [Nicrophorus vespilloides]|uniref:Uncharacterized protein LOC108564041 isoform X3 n=1 Tax=Nicrophorus vespilloides TaxID=110193 RepID=A0ABM1MV20_NICVS|nr:PREDICTED: uncharacterized protein LOC108564041 isoform X3 [Nicrophorus vespilloides]